MRLPDYAGPLAGMLAGLAHCDTPVPGDGAVRYAELSARPGRAAHARPRGSGRRHGDGLHARRRGAAPPTGVLPDEGLRCATACSAFVKSGQRKTGLGRPAALRAGRVRGRERVLQCQHAGRPRATADRSITSAAALRPAPAARIWPPPKLACTGVVPPERHADRAVLELRDLAERIERRIGELVDGRLVKAKGDEHRAVRRTLVGARVQT